MPQAPFPAPSRPLRPRSAATVTLLLLPCIALAFTGATEADVPGTLACLGLAFAVYWSGCVENRFQLDETRILVLGLLMRACLLPMPPSDDMHRFIWEGKILAYGFNPFLAAPSDPSLAALRDANWALINHPDLPTLYPPVAQAFFFLLAKLGQSGLVFKLGFVVFDVLGFLVLRSIVRRKYPGVGPGAAHHNEVAVAREGAGAREGAVAREGAGPPAATEAPGAYIQALYFLNPLLIFEIAGRGHFESLPVFLNLIFLGALMARKPWAPAALGLGALAKISSLALAPLLLFSLGWKRALLWGAALGAVVGGTLWVVGAFTVLGKFATRFHFNAAVPSLIDAARPFLSEAARRNLATLLFGLAVLLCLWFLRKAAPERQGLWFTGLLLLFSPTLHPWYLLWTLPFAALCVSRPWLLLTGTALVSYEVYGRFHVTGLWQERAWLRLPEYLPPLALLLYLAWGKRRAARAIAAGTDARRSR